MPKQNKVAEIIQDAKISLRKEKKRNADALN
jgi:hypothetical protein